MRPPVQVWPLPSNPTVGAQPYLRGGTLFGSKFARFFLVLRKRGGGDAIRKKTQKTILGELLPLRFVRFFFAPKKKKRTKKIGANNDVPPSILI